MKTNRIILLAAAVALLASCTSTIEVYEQNLPERVEQHMCSLWFYDR